MAVSPLIPNPASHAAKTTDATRESEVNGSERSPYKHNMKYSSHVTNEREITEQLNDDVRHKYIKGMILYLILLNGSMHPPLLLALLPCRCTWRLMMSMVVS